jgi:hypothetical protein
VCVCVCVFEASLGYIVQYLIFCPDHPMECLVHPLDVLYCISALQKPMGWIDGW